MADSHLGFQNFSKVDKKGRNLVEEMVYRGFEDSIERLIELKPDAIVHSGDIFHHVRPRIRPLYVFKQALDKLHAAGIPMIAISGNHDAPKGYSSISPFYIYEGMPDVHIAHRYSYECFEEGDHRFHCIPFCLDPEDYMNQFRKIERCGRDVLLMHGMIESLWCRRMRTVGEHELSGSFLKSDLDYIALGHFHGQTKIAENAWYSGSIEYFTFGESGDTKGVLMVDLDKDPSDDHRVKQIDLRPKYIIDTAPIDCSGLSSAEIGAELMGLCDASEINDKIVRINLKNVSRAAYRNLDHKKLSKLIAPALYLKVNVNYSDESDAEERSIDTVKLHEEFALFLKEEASRGSIPRAIEMDVLAYGQDLMKRTVEDRNTEVLNAPQ
jgi:DNA repair protein SbcD/Mre11